MLTVQYTAGATNASRDSDEVTLQHNTWSVMSLKHVMGRPAIMHRHAPLVKRSSLELNNIICMRGKVIVLKTRGMTMFLYNNSSTHLLEITAIQPSYM